MRVEAESGRKQFIRMMDTLCVRHNRGKVWRDMISLWALDISNAVDSVNRGERETEYKRIAGGYTQDELVMFARLLAKLIDIYEEEGFADVLGALFMEMELGNDAGGQFFTPYNVTRMMARVGVESAEQAISEHGYTQIADPACGGGATLIAAAEQLVRDGYNYQQCALFAGQDVDCETAMMCYVQMSLLGMPGIVKIENTLKSPASDAILLMKGPDIWRTPMLETPTWKARQIVEATRQMQREAGWRE